MNNTVYSARQTANKAVYNDVHPSPYQTLAPLVPWLVAAYAWLWWAAFMVLSTLLGAHDTHYFSSLENGMYCLLGLVLCLAVTIAAQDDQPIRAVFMAASVHLLAYWF